MEPSTRSGNSNFVRYIRSLFQPVESQGSRPINFDIDNVGESQLSMSADQSFTMRVYESDVDRVVRIAQVASPIVTHLIYCSTGAGSIEIKGASSFIMDDHTVAVVGNKLEYLGNYVAPSDFTPKEDYRQFRILAISDKIEYTGKVLDVNGTTYTAMMQSPLEMSTVSPSQIADSVRAPVVKAITRIGQHKEPTFRYNYVEPSDNVDSKEKITINNSFDFTTDSSADSVWSTDAIQCGALETPFTIADAATSITDKVQTMFNNSLSVGTIEDFNSYMDEINNRYGIYQDEYKTFTITHSKGFLPKAYVNRTMPAVGHDAFINLYEGGYYEEPEASTKFQGTNIKPGPTAYLEHLFGSNDLISEMNDWITAKPAPNYNLPAGKLLWGGTLQFSFEFLPRKAPSLRLDDMAKYPSVNLQNIIYEDETSTFVDSHYKVPVTEITAIGNLDFLVTFRCLYQLILNDKSVLAEQAKMYDAQKDTIKANNLERVIRVLRMGAPAYIEGEEQEQMRARGIFSQLAEIVGPIVGTIFPPIGGVIQNGGKIIDNMINK